MQTSIYIDNHQFRAIVGKDNGRTVKINKYCYQSLAPGLVKNGVIENFSGLAQSLSVFFAQNHLSRRQVNLVLDCDSAVTKIMETPLLPAKKLRQLIQGEFTAQNGTDLLCDYQVLKPVIKPAGGRILACGLDKQITGQFLDLFNRIGVELVNMDLALTCAIHFCNRINGLRRQTYIVTVLEGTDIVSMLFIDGVYSVSNRSRLFEQRGTPAAAVEISRTLSSLAQFNTAQKNGQVITNAIICGMQGDEMDFCADISALLDMQVEIMPEWPEIKFDVSSSKVITAGDYIYCIGDIMRRN
ncbi:MAG: hypothetical protein RR387_04265 [Clostridiales bacterium]